MRDVLERLGLILFGAALILLGIHMLSSGSGSSTVNNYTQSGGSSKSATAGKSESIVGKTGASQAAEAAIVA
jgi:hypothetical protein